MYHGPMRDEITRFVATLRIPEPRKAVVLAELLDHEASAREAALRDARDPDAAVREAIGDLEALRRSLEAVEPAFHVSRGAMLARGMAAGGVIAIVVDQLQYVAAGVLAAAITLAIAVLSAPPRIRELLRPEIRDNRIGPAVVYGYTVLATPFLIWIGMIVVRGFAFGKARVDTPWCAFILVPLVLGTLAFEKLRSRVAA
jgi:hypothetical protein